MLLHKWTSLKHVQAYYWELKLGHTLPCMLQLPLSYNANLSTEDQDTLHFIPPTLTFRC